MSHDTTKVEPAGWPSLWHAFLTASKRTVRGRPTIMTQFRIIGMVSVSVLVGCSAPKGKGALYKEKTRVLRSLPTERELLGSQYRMRAVAFPSERSPFLRLRLERFDKYAIISKREVVTIAVWRRNKDMGDIYSENPVVTTIAGILYPLSTSFCAEFISKSLCNDSTLTETPV